MNIEMDDHSSTFCDQDLNNFLSNRRQLDFALKLALGSQTNLHQISILQEDSASISSLDHHPSPYKSQAKYNTKKSRFASKQNLNHLDMKVLQKAASIKPENRILKQKWYKTVSWVNFISKHFNLSALSGQDLNLSQLNAFFKDVVYKLQKLQQLQAQQYNAKFLLCQLTQLTLKKEIDAQKIQKLTIMVAQKQNTIQQLEDFITSLKKQRNSSEAYTLNEDINKDYCIGGKAKKNEKQTSPKLYSKIGTDSLIFSISQVDSQINSSPAIFNINKQSRNQPTADRSLIAHQCNEQNQEDQMLLISSTQFIKKNDTKQQSHQSNKDLNLVKINLQNKFQAIEQAHNQLKNQQQRSCSQRQSIENSINRSQEQYSKGTLQHSLSKETIRMQELLQIKQQMIKILQENDYLREKIRSLKRQLESGCSKQNSVMNSTKENLHYDPSVSISMNQLKMEHQSVIKQKQYLNQYNQNLRQNVEEMHQKAHSQQQLIQCLTKQNKKLQEEITYMKSKLQQWKTVNANIQEQVQFLRQRLIQLKPIQLIIQTEDVSVQKDTSLKGQSPPNQQTSQEFLLEDKNIKQNDFQKLAEILQVNQEYKRQNSLLKQKYQKVKILMYYNQEAYQKIKKRLLKKCTQLKQIKCLIKQAKKINQSDMRKLEETILGRRMLKEKQIQQLKAMEEAWRGTLNKQKYQKSTSPTPKLELANNRFRLIAGMKSKGKRLSKDRRLSTKKTMQKIVQDKKCEDKSEESQLLKQAV